MVYNVAWKYPFVPNQCVEKSDENELEIGSRARRCATDWRFRLRDVLRSGAVFSAEDASRQGERRYLSRAGHLVRCRALRQARLQL